MQGVVYGTRIPEMEGKPELATRFDFDECFGTAINRFCAQAVAGIPITPYGKGEQKRGFLPLVDSMQCLQIAIDNPPEHGDYRVWNQFEEVYTINDLASTVCTIASSMGLETCVQRIPNPRKELEDHYYTADTSTLTSMGYKPTNDLEGQISGMLEDLVPHKQRILDHVECITPKIKWN
jgi:UDP-sulfoquinovose synthase